MRFYDNGFINIIIIIMWLAKKGFYKKVQTVRRRDGWLA